MNVNSETKRSSPEAGVELMSHQVLPEVDLSLLDSQEKLLDNSTETRPERPVAMTNTDTKPKSAISNIPVVDNQSPTTDNTNPSVNSSTTIQASDSDRIEQEWVDRVKNVLAATIDNPYEREEQIKDLQADYIFKRYGRKIGQQETVA